MPIKINSKPLNKTQLFVFSIFFGCTNCNLSYLKGIVYFTESIKNLSYLFINAQSELNYLNKYGVLWSINFF